MKKILYMFFGIILLVGFAGCTVLQKNVVPGANDEEILAIERKISLSGGNVDLDANGAMDVAFGGTNAKTAASARTSLGAEAAGAGATAAAAVVSNIAYGSGWSGVTGIAPSKDAIYTYLSSLSLPTNLGTAAYMDTGITVGTVALGNHLHTGVYDPSGSAAAVVSDIPYAASWNNVTGIAPSKNALYDYLSTLALANHVHTGVYQPASVNIPTVVASQAEMQTGTEAALRSMSPLLVAQAIAALASGESTNGWDYTPRSVAPTSPVIGKVYLANNDVGGWDPISYTGTTDYFVLYTGSTYVGIVDIYGNLLLNTLLGDDTAYNTSTWDGSTKPPTQNSVRDKIESLVIPVASDVAYDATSWDGNANVPTKNAIRDKIEALIASPTSEVDGHSPGNLTVAQVSNTIIYNTGQDTMDVALVLPTGQAGLSAMFTVGTAQSFKWGVRAGTTDKIYLLNADGSISPGIDNGYARMTNAQVGQSFGCWTFKTDAYDWMCKSISIGTSTFAGN